MRHAMLEHVGIRREARLANITLVRFMARMNAIMNRQIGVLPKRLGTLGTLEGSLACMDHLVRLHIVLVAEQLVTDVAPVTTSILNKIFC